MSKSDKYQEWDEIFKEREKFLKENPEARNMERPKTFEDEDGDIRCTKCGSTEDIGNCPECVQESDFLNQLNL